jgi:hypothetical protein
MAIHNMGAPLKVRCEAHHRKRLEPSKELQKIIHLHTQNFGGVCGNA